MDIKKLKKLKAYILKHPEKYVQQHYALGPKSAYAKKHHCGTAHCLAGAACAMEGWKFVFDAGDSARFVHKNGATRHIPSVASEILGFASMNDSENLFTGAMTGWDPDNQRAYFKARRPLGRVKAAVAELDLYILGYKG